MVVARLVELVLFLGLLVVVASNEVRELPSEDDKSDQSYLSSAIGMAMDQYHSMYYHQGKRGGKGKWSNGIAGLPSPRIAKKHITTFLQSEPEENLFGSVSLKSYIRLCTNLMNNFPRMHHGVGGGIIIAIHSYQEEEYSIVRGFCTEAGTIYYFNKEMESLIRESSKPNSLIPPLRKSIFDQYEAGGNWDDFVENCEDLIKEHRKRVIQRESSSKWSMIDFSEISDFCEEVSDDIYPNNAQSKQEWAHIYALQNYIIERKGEMGAPIIGIPMKKPEYYVAGRHQSSMYRKCLRALWDMFQYDDEVDLKIAGVNQYETLRSFCNAAKNYYTRGGRVSSSPMINIGDPPRKRKLQVQEGGLVKQILEKQRNKEQAEQLLTMHMRKRLEKQQEEKIKQRREIRKKAKESNIDPSTSEFPVEGIFSPKELPSPKEIQPAQNVLRDLPSTSFQEDSLLEPQLIVPTVEKTSESEEGFNNFGLEAAQEEFENIV
ncbi:putative signal peptide-containing protein [Cryptosporidium canis]|nr:putative signal peptide-containing protein [Cryptosporidium canis]